MHEPTGLAVLLRPNFTDGHARITAGILAGAKAEASNAPPL